MSWTPRQRARARFIGKMLRRRPATQLKHTAYHEAGHAVVGIANGLRVAFVNVVPEGNRLGQASSGLKVNAAVGLGSSWHRERVLSTMLAGHEAVRRLTGAAISDLWRGSSDASDARKIVREVHNTDERPELRNYAKGDLESCRCDARDTVREHWSAIESVAAALIEKRRLSWRQLYRIATTASPGLKKQYRSMTSR